MFLTSGRRATIDVTHFGQSLSFCLMGQAPQLKKYPTSTLVSIGFTMIDHTVRTNDTTVGVG